MEKWNKFWKFCFVLGVILGYLSCSYLYYIRHEVGKEVKKSFIYYLNPFVN
jgi:CRISPR/Cas system-associated exonuclease Cas4 (RecB family)